MDGFKLKKELVQAIKEYPQVWDTENPSSVIDTDTAWDNIADKFNMTRKELRNMWRSMRKYYFDILVAKTIQRNTSRPQWILFHSMSFMYEIIKKKVAGKLGGLMPPLFIPMNVNENTTCPCCLPFSAEAAATAEDQMPKRQKEPYELPLAKRQKLYNSKHMEEFSIARRKIIDAIRAFPVLHQKTLKPNQNESKSSKEAWNRVAEQVGLPLVTIQGRWRLFKDRYVSELIREKRCAGVYRSAWEGFERMSFMREVLRDSVEDMIKTRDAIQQMVNEKRNGHIIDLCDDEDDSIDEQISNDNSTQSLQVGNANIFDPSSCEQPDFSKSNVQASIPTNNNNCPVIAIEIESSEDEGDEYIYRGGVNDACDETDLGEQQISQKSPVQSIEDGNVNVLGSNTCGQLDLFESDVQASIHSNIDECSEMALESPEEERYVEVLCPIEDDPYDDETYLGEEKIPSITQEVDNASPLGSKTCEQLSFAESNFQASTLSSNNERPVIALDLSEDERDADVSYQVDQAFPNHSPTQSLGVGNTNALDSSTCEQLNFVEGIVQAATPSSIPECPVIALDLSEDEREGENFCPVDQQMPNNSPAQPLDVGNANACDECPVIALDLSDDEEDVDIFGPGDQQIPNKSFEIANANAFNLKKCEQLNSVKSTVQTSNFSTIDEGPVTTFDLSEDERNEDILLHHVVQDFDEDDNESFVTNSSINEREIFLAEDDDQKEQIETICLDDDASLSS